MKFATKTECKSLRELEWSVRCLYTLRNTDAINNNNMIYILTILIYALGVLVGYIYGKTEQ